MDEVMMTACMNKLDLIVASTPYNRLLLEDRIILNNLFYIIEKFSLAERLVILHVIFACLMTPPDFIRSDRRS